MTLSSADMAGRFGVDLSELTLKPRYNLTPGQEAPVILANTNGRQVKMMQWGLIPHWAKVVPALQRQRRVEGEAPTALPVEGATRAPLMIINARAETVAAKPAFRDALKCRRCLIPADGFYEWAKKITGRGKTPYRFTLKDGEPFAFAGLWDRWVDPKGGSLSSFTIITTQTNEIVSKVHDRMPVILPREDEEKWLDPGLTDPSVILKPCPANWMKDYEVSTVINSAKNDGAECVQPA